MFRRRRPGIHVQHYDWLQIPGPVAAPLQENRVLRLWIEESDPFVILVKEFDLFNWVRAGQALMDAPVEERLRILLRSYLRLIW